MENKFYFNKLIGNVWEMGIIEMPLKKRLRLALAVLFKAKIVFTGNKIHYIHNKAKRSQ